MNLAELKEDERFLTNPLRLDNRPALNAYLETAFRQMDFQSLMQECVAKGVTIAPVNDLEEVFAIPAAQDLILEERLEDGTVTKRVKTTVFKIQF